MNFQIPYLKTSLLLAVVGGLTACADSDNIAGSIDAPDSAATLSGTAVKGIIANADCIVLDSDGETELYSSVNSPTPCTGPDGTYTITLPSLPSNGAAIVKIVGRAGATMLCDSPTGCGEGSSFNETIDFAPGSELSAILPSVTSTVVNTVNVTPWTHIATNRALTSRGTAALSADIVEFAYQETAAVLNNLLGLEGTDDQFTSDFFDIPPVSLNDASSTTTPVSDQKQATLLSVASASLFGLIDGTNATTITQVVTNMVTAFSTDGAFNVNDDATGIVESDLIDLAAIATNIATVATNLSTVVNAEDLTSLTTFLEDVTLTQIAETVTEIATEKDAVTDVALDTTAPVKPVDTSGLTASGKGLDIAVQLDNVLHAADPLFNSSGNVDRASGILGDVDILLRSSSIDESDVIDNVADVLALAAEMLGTADDVLTGIGCSVTETQKSCPAANLGILLDDEAPIASATTGTFTLTIGTNVVQLADLMLGNLTYALEMVGDGSILSTATSATYEINSVTVMDGETSIFSVGDTSNMMGTYSSGNLQTATINLVDVSMAVTGIYAFEGNILNTMTYRSGATEFSQRVLSVVNMDGSLTNNMPNGSLTTTFGQTVKFSLDYTIDTSTLTPGSVPTDTASAEPTTDSVLETTENYYKIDNFSFTLEAPVSFQKRVTNADKTGTEQGSTSSSGVLRIVAGFTRPTATDVTTFDLNFVLASGGSSFLLDGSVVVNDTANTETFTFTNGVEGVSLSIASTSTDGVTTYSGGITADATQVHTIGGSGVVSINTFTETPDDDFSFQLALTDPES